MYYVLYSNLKFFQMCFAWTLLRFRNLSSWRRGSGIKKPSCEKEASIKSSFKIEISFCI